MDQLTQSIVSILTAVVGVALLATIVSKKSNTAGVLTAGASGFSQILGTALSPVTGSNMGFSSNAINTNITGSVF